MQILDFLPYIDFSHLLININIPFRFAISWNVIYVLSCYLQGKIPISSKTNTILFCHVFQPDEIGQGTLGIFHFSKQLLF